MSDQTVALNFKPTQNAPDVTGTINSLAQLQYYGQLGQVAEANAKKLQAETSGLQSLNSANTDAYARIQGGENPENVTQGLSIYNPVGATAVNANTTAALATKAQRGYAASLPDNPLAIGGPGDVQKGAEAQSSLADAEIKHAQLRGQAASSILAAAGPDGKSPIPQAVKTYWLDNLVKQGAISPARAQELSEHSDGELIALAKGIQSQGMTPTESAAASGNTVFNAGYANAATGIHQVTPGNSLAGGAAGIAAARGQGATPSADVATPTQPARPEWASTNGQGSPGLSNNSMNNPGNIRDGAFAQSQPGYLGQKNGFAVFESPIYGQAAMEKNLISYGNKGINTPLAIASKWAPAGDGANNPQNYAHFVAGRLGIGVNDPINIADPAQRKALAVAMSQMENGTKGMLGAGGPPSVIAPAQLTASALAPRASAPVAGIASPNVMPGASQILSNALQRGPVPTPQIPAPAVPQQAPAAQPAPTPVAVQAAPTQPLIAPGGSTPAAAGAANPNVLSEPSIGPPSGTAPNPNVLVPGMSISDVAAAHATGEATARIQAEQFQQAQQQYRDAQNAQLSLQQLQKSLSDVKDSSGLTNFFLAPGSGATERAGWAKEINTRLSQIGLPPLIDPGKISSAEEAQKITGRLGFDTSRTLGSREAASIVQEAIHLNPGLENTPQGAKVVASSINAAAQRSKDFYTFLTENGSKPGADLAFDRAHPVAQYVREAEALARIPQSSIDLLEKHANDPRAIAAFDRQYGSGLHRYYTGAAG